MADFVLSKLADQDLEDIAAYTVLNFGINEALEYKASIAQSAKTAGHFPSIGKPYTTQKGHVFQRYNIGRHALFYQPTEAGIFIVRILHQMMDLDRHLDE